MAAPFIYDRGEWKSVGKLGVFAAKGKKNGGVMAQLKQLIDNRLGFLDSAQFQQRPSVGVRAIY
jgi:hypothetical protein